MASSTELGSEASGRKGASSETHGGLSSLDPLEASQQTSRFAPAEGDQEVPCVRGQVGTMKLEKILQSQRGG